MYYDVDFTTVILASVNRHCKAELHFLVTSSFVAKATSHHQDTSGLIKITLQTYQTVKT